MNKKSFTMICGMCLAMAYAEDTSVGVSSSHMYKINASTDVLGRHNSKVAKSPTVFLKSSKMRPTLKKSDGEDPVIEASTGRYEKKKIGNSYQETYWFNNQEMDSATYVQRAAQYDQRFADTINFQGRAYVNSNTNNYTYSKVPNDYYDQDIYIKPIENNALDTFFNINTSIMENGLYYNAIAKKERGQEIGVYMMERAEPNKDEASFRNIFVCNNLVHPNANEAINHASKAVKIVNHLAKNATVYSIDISCLIGQNDIYPNRPDRYYPYPLYIGNHTDGRGESNIYNSTSQFIDNYVYNTRVIEIASAGNFATNSSVNNQNITPVGQGMNVITVGAARRHASGKYTYYDQSSIKNPRLCGTKTSETSKYYDKPEIINVANVFFSKGYTYTYSYYGRIESYPPTFGHTSSAAPYTTSMIADFLHQKPFYKWHPEVVKALLLTASVKALESNKNQQDDINGNSNKLIGRGIPSYNAMVYGNRSRYWLGNKDDYFKTKQIYYKNRNVSKNVIEFKESQITAGKTYRIAIAWLVDGNYISQQYAVPQDIDLMVSQAGNSTVEYSTTSSNPFEMVEFKATNSNDLTITIVRHHNQGNNRVMLGYNLYEVP